MTTTPDDTTDAQTESLEVPVQPEDGDEEEEHHHYASQNVGNDWGTPEWIWGPLADALGGFDLDPASGCEPEPIADARYTIEDDGLATPWFGNVFINPPYAREINEDWAERIAGQAGSEMVDTVTALVPMSCGTAWWHRHYRDADVYTLVGDDTESPRVNFLNADGIESENNASFASVILSYGEFPDAYYAELNDLGFVLEPRT